jgi:hypothetical protein
MTNFIINSSSSSSMVCKQCHRTLDILAFALSRRKHHLCRTCDQKHASLLQRKRQKHPAFKSIRKVKTHLRELRKKGVRIGKAWLNVREYENFVTKWGRKSALSAAVPREEKEKLFFWFKELDLEKLSLENAFPCTKKELNLIVNHANGDYKLALSLLSGGDETQRQELLNKLD